MLRLAWRLLVGVGGGYVAWRLGFDGVGFHPRWVPAALGWAMGLCSFLATARPVHSQRRRLGSLVCIGALVIVAVRNEIYVPALELDDPSSLNEQTAANLTQRLEDLEKACQRLEARVSYVRR